MERIGWGEVRVALLLALLLAAGGGAAWLMLRDPEQERERLALEAREALAEVGVRKLLDGSERWEFRDVVIGTMAPTGAVDFRALVQEEDSMRPTFGRAEPVCTDGLEQAACWRIGLLEVDGRDVLAGGPAMPAGAAADAPAPTATR